jgi:hypothetical protein
MGLIGGMARTAVVAGTATAVSNRVSRRQAGRWAAQEQQQAPQYAPAPQYVPPPEPQYAPPPEPQYAPAAAPDPDADLARLKQLGDLRAAGVLTEQEFQAQKARLLGM